MKATKLELQQNINRLSDDNQFLREKLSVLSTENNILRAKLDEADVRCKKLIASRNHGNPSRRAAMEAARQEAMRTGKIARVSNEGGVSALEAR